MRCYQLC